jgi:hypothetical protein
MLELASRVLVRVMSEDVSCCEVSSLKHACNRTRPGSADTRSRFGPVAEMLIDSINGEQCTRELILSTARRGNSSMKPYSGHLRSPVLKLNSENSHTSARRPSNCFQFQLASCCKAKIIKMPFFIVSVRRRA